MNIIDRIKCIHRHNINEHGACFSAGSVNQQQAEALEKEYGKPWYQVEGLKIGYLDIESDGLQVDFSTMLSWCIKEKDGATVYDMITKKELFSGEGDKRLIESIIREMMKYKIIVTYFGTIFDLTFIRAKALHYNLYFPGYISEQKTLKSGEIATKIIPELYHFDMYYIAKSKLASLSSKRLENVCDYLGIEGKTPLKRDIWRAGKYGDPIALKEILAHNVGDVEILEKLHNRLEPFAKYTRKSV